MLSDKLIKSFWAKVEVKAPDECWPWKAHTDKGGYGRMKIPGTRIMVYAHRVSIMIKEGKWMSDTNQLGCHSCDNPSCCNPNHLSWGNAFYNMSDMANKGRARLQIDRPTGSKNANSKLTESDVRRIKYLIEVEKMNNCAIARHFESQGIKITHHTVSLIRLGKQWKHVT